ncbi:hypothetical protein INT44_001542 [Umbelopsis vinacea]|uniref:Uncharacterized protein n=1 Tax=Umbelopsis vinacea TaxID=44442 RepID=A0A8H7PR53_9FUNG|nr:hypothetical protein INT44_001542 [Umbelopsis vinacea]KAI9283448.1 hypothetical protein BC943DRAFT_308771 [Umbelopsis sp. AD052]
MSININIKSSSDKKFVITIEPSKTILDLKEAIAAQTDVPADRQRLIFSGRVLKDNDLLSDYKVADGNTIHMVKGAAPNQPKDTSSASAGSNASAPVNASTPTTQASVQSPITSPSATPANPFAALGGGAGGMNPWGMGGGMGGGMGAAAGLGGGAAPDQNMMNQMLQNPMFAQYMSTMLQNPAVLDSIIQTNPHLSSMGPEIRQMMQSPEFRQMISNPDTIRQMAQMSSAMQGMGGGAGGMPPAGGFGGSPFGMGSPPATEQQQGSAAPPFNPFAAFGNPMLQQNTSAPADNRPPEERFQVQLQQLNEMGLWDAAKNIRALQSTNGDVNAAIEILFSGGNI